ncbi:hypothetical protein MPL3365_110121 [Mesorhizobium plurifarium]|uniref:Uncharacterized protein n=1 Tax=Mesorhizobium plurifarium TaxID=69974 RepID=A0A090G1A2_MESPL|nr:hypothetical protein MPL3365_110121 [Mesorhizobium plurifarium]
MQNRALRFMQGFFLSTYFDADSFDRRVIIRLNRQRHCVVPMIGSAIVQGSGAKKRAIGRRASKPRGAIEKSRCNPGSKLYD